MDFDDVDHVVVYFDIAEEEIFFSFRFSEYTTNKIKLVYGEEPPASLMFVSNDDQMDEIMSQIPPCYRCGASFVLPFQEYEILYSYITQNIDEYLQWNDMLNYSKLAKSNKTSLEKFYEQMKHRHQTTIDNLDNAYKKFC